LRFVWPRLEGFAERSATLAFQEIPMPPEFDDLWDFSDPAATEAAFRELFADAPESLRNTDWRWQLLTQIARAQGLQREFDAAHCTLDEVEAHLPNAGDTTRVRWLLERGRVFNSSKQPERARPLFLEAWELGRTSGDDGFAVDAAHMLAIVESPEKALDWNRQALELATTSADPQARRWAGSLHNNIGWSHFSRQDYATALSHFEQALQCRIEQGKTDDVRVARWCVAKALRLLERTTEALDIQRQLHTEWEADGHPDGYVDEELGECLLSLGRPEEAAPHFANACERLSQDAWLVENEPERLARLKSLGSVTE
jgi:tetratricopeptide (TPR) repeat protein